MRLVFLASALGNLPKYKYAHKADLCRKKYEVRTLILTTKKNGFLGPE